MKIAKIKTLKFNIQLNASHYTNFNSMYVCLLIKIKSKKKYQ